jgi:hypothetical protein
MPQLRSKTRKNHTAILDAKIAKVIARLDEMLTAIEEEIADLTCAPSKTTLPKRCTPRVQKRLSRPKGGARLSRFPARRDLAS